ncbi:MAG TPA: hypothetical protein VKZ89_18330 [Thermobifida alba]|nr:hypothetical protein [Thermobifida alba]
MNIPSAPRRRLGTGPSTTRSTSTTATAPRLLPAERADPDGLLEEAEHQDVPAPKGRRNLGPGTAVAPDGAQ